MSRSRVAVVGGGALGVAVARELALHEPRARVTLFEGERALALHQSGRNSGVVHAGVYYRPGSLKARLCRRGAELIRSYAHARAVPYEQCGKLIVATDDGELERLGELERRARENGVPGVRMLNPDQLRAVEPHARGVAALHSPTSAVVDFRALTEAMAAEVRAAGGEIMLGARVDAVEPSGRLRAGVRTLSFDRVVVCAGLESDRLAGDRAQLAIVPFRGDYVRLRAERRALVRGLIYPVPDPRYPFLGVHLTRRVDGEVLIGPSAVVALAREGYERRSFNLRDTVATLRWPGFWRMAAANWRAGAVELAHAIAPDSLVRAARRYVPELRPSDVEPAPSGVRAQAVSRAGELVDDFRIAQAGVVLHVRNAPSPAATSCMAIAEDLRARL